MDVFCAFLAALNSGAVTTNMKDMIIAINLLLQLTPPVLWGGPLHISGLFAHLLNTLIEDRVYLILVAPLNSTKIYFG